MRLERIKVSGFKSFKGLDLTMRSLNVLIGANGSGKSNFIGLFRMLNDIVTPGLGLQNFVAKNGRAESLLHYGSKTSDHIKMDFRFGDNLYSISLAKSLDDSLFFQKEMFVTIDDKSGKPIMVTSNFEPGHRETKLPEVGSSIYASFDAIEIHKQLLSEIRAWRVFHFHDTSNSAAVKRSSYIYDNKYLRSDGENLAAFLYLLKQEFPKSYESIRSTVQIVAPFFDDFVFQLLPGQDNHVKLDWREKGSDYPFQVFQLSDGILRFICLATVLHLPDEYLPSAILIDEPEMGLHPLALSVLAALIRQAARKTQVIISTQSVALVNEFAPEDLIVVDRKNRETTLTRPSNDSLQGWLEDYSLGELWEKNVIGGRPSR